jgi:hypothetical protein
MLKKSASLALYVNLAQKEEEKEENSNCELEVEEEGEAGKDNILTISADVLFG